MLNGVGRLVDWLGLDGLDGCLLLGGRLRPLGCLVSLYFFGIWTFLGILFSRYGGRGSRLMGLVVWGGENWAGTREGTRGTEERNGKERKGKERKGKEREGKGKVE